MTFSEGGWFCFSVVVVLSLSVCITKRTVTKDGLTVEQNDVIKRPITNAIKNMEIEWAAPAYRRYCAFWMRIRCTSLMPSGLWCVL